MLLLTTLAGIEKFSFLKHVIRVNSSRSTNFQDYFIITESEHDEFTVFPYCNNRIKIFFTL